MGTQQLLVIVLGVITVGLAVALAIGIFGLSFQQSNADAVVADCMRLATGAQQWYTKPTCLGGGGRSYVGLNVQRAGFNKPTNENGSYSISNISHNSIQIIGTGKENVIVNVTVFPDSISSPVITTI